MKNATALTKAVALGSEFFGVVGGAINFLVGTFTTIARVETFVASIALEATLVPWLKIKSFDTLNTLNNKILLSQKSKMKSFRLATDFFSFLFPTFAIN